MSEKKGPAENGRMQGKRTPRALLAGLALVALLVTVSCGGVTGDERATAVEPQAAVDLGNPSLGEEDAPVVLIEYSDLQ